MSLNPDVVLMEGHPKDLINRVRNLLAEMFPDIPRTPRYWSLEPTDGRPRQARLTLRLTDEVSVVMLFEDEGASMGFLQIPAALSGTDVRGLPAGSKSSVERMALRNDVWSDFQGWLYRIKTVCEDKYLPPPLYEVTSTMALICPDGRKGRDVTFHRGDKVEVHPTLRGIRAHTTPSPPTDLQDWSWTHTDVATVIAEGELVSLPPVRVQRFKVMSRYGLIDVQAQTPVRFEVGTWVEVLSDGTAIRTASETPGPMDPTHESWTQLDPTQSSGTVWEAIRHGVFAPEGEST